SLIEYALEKVQARINDKTFNDKGAVFNIMTEQNVWEGFRVQNERLIDVIDVLS
ncbi:hypothetical protein JHD50_09835, partial [Sulfurimonas sp. MAG313]|nr:hypothetical protein [Sulfurimonas sp. MAG313]